MELVRKQLSRDSRIHANVFNCNSDVSDVVNEGEKALLSPFCGKPGEGLNAIRYQRYFEKPQRRRLILSHRVCPHQGQLILPSCTYLQAKQCQGEGVGMSTGEVGVENHQLSTFPKIAFPVNQMQLFV